MTRRIEAVNIELPPYEDPKTRITINMDGEPDTPIGFWLHMPRGSFCVDLTADEALFLAKNIEAVALKYKRRYSEVPA